MRISYKNPLYFIVLFAMTLAAQDKVYYANEPFRIIEKDFSQGKINYEQALLEKFYIIFDNQKSSYISPSANVKPIKCGTDLIMEYQAAKENLSERTKQIIDEYLNRPFRKTAIASTYISPSGRFELTYSTSGIDAVPAEDQNSNGTPDYVEWVAQYFDYSWEFTIDSLGYLPPPIDEKRYQIGFQKMDHTYGLTNPEDDSTNYTYITMHNNYSGFPPNDDPEGDQKGAAKVTAMHEFKHAVQFVYNKWDDPKWFIEMDATWMEDIGYDYVNDYYWYLSSSQLLFPNRSFASGYGYEDCLWLHYISQEYGVESNRLLWVRRMEKRSENIFTTFQSVLTQYSSSYTKALTEFFEWNYFTGSRANEIFKSYEEAAFYPTSYVCLSKSFLPDSSAGCIVEPGGASYLVYKGINVNKPAKFTFEPSSERPYNIELLVLYKNGTSAKKSFSDIYGMFSYTFTEALSSIEYFVVIPVVASTSGINLSYYCTIKPYVVAEFSMVPVRDTESSIPRKITAKVNNPAGLAVMSKLGINYSVNGSEYKLVNMVSTGNPNEYSGTIPPAASGSTVEYYLSIADVYGELIYYPERGAEDPLSYYVGPDVTPPSLVVSRRNVLNKYNFPVNLYAEAADNIGIDSVYAEYRFNNGEIHTAKLEVNEINLYSGRISPNDLSPDEITNFKYKIAAVDISSNHNKNFYPESGYISIDLDDGFEFFSNPSKIIKDSDALGVKDSILIPDNLFISDLNVSLNITHSRISDLIVKLTPPQGNQAILFSRLGSGSGGYDIKNPDIIIDQDAYYNIKFFRPDNDSTLSGEYKADTLNLDNYNGRNAKGTWILNVIDLALGVTGILNEWKLIIGSPKTVSVDDGNLPLVMEYTLMQNYPNPFNPVSNFRFRIADFGHVEIKIYDIIGREVAVLMNEEKPAGEYNLKYNGSAMASGVYYYQLRVNGHVFTRKMVLLK